MAKTKSKEDIQFEKDMKIIEKGGRNDPYEDLDFSKSGNPKQVKPKETKPAPKKK